MEKLSSTLSPSVRHASGTGDRKFSSFSKHLKLRGLPRITAIMIALSFSPQLMSAQKIDTSGSSGLTHSTYMPSQRATARAGWFRVSPGAAMAAMTGIILVNNTGYFFPSGHTTNKEFLYLGGVMALTSIPFFLSAGRSKAKAYLSLKRGMVAFAERCPDNFSYLAVSLKVKF